MTRTLGQGRAATLALLHEMVAQNTIRATGPIPPQSRRGMPSCLNHTLTHPLAWEEPGVGTQL